METARVRAPIANARNKEKKKTIKSLQLSIFIKIVQCIDQ